MIALLWLLPQIAGVQQGVIQDTALYVHPSGAALGRQTDG